MGLLVIDPGFWTTVQDSGRVGYREWGVPPAGAFDRASAELANALAGNESNCALLELTLQGGVFEASDTLGIAIAGAPIEAAVVNAEGGRRSVRVPSCTTLHPGERLVFGRMLEGARSYLAISGGLHTAPRLGSRSSEFPLVAGDALTTQPHRLPTRVLLEPAWISPTSRAIRILNGPDGRGVLDGGDWSRGSFRVSSRSNRMGLRLEGHALRIPPLPDRLSAPVAPGAIQVAGEQLIILGVAGGTMGGYPHVGHVISADLDRIGQLRPGDTIRFQRVDLSEARNLDRMARIAHRSLLMRISLLTREP
jgi:biotin-dependent carboxylase-like uncharacterized protein